MHQNKRTNCSSKADMIPFHAFDQNKNKNQSGAVCVLSPLEWICLNSTRVCNRGGVIIIVLSTLKYTNVLSVCPKPTRYRCIYNPKKINPEPCVVAMHCSACILTAHGWLCNCDRAIVHSTPGNITFESKNALIQTYALFVQSHNDTISCIQVKSQSKSM